MTTRHEKRDVNIERELLLHRIISVLWSMIVAQTDHVIHGKIIQPWNRLNNDLIKLRRLDKNLFADDLKPRSVQIDYPNDQKKSDQIDGKLEWGIYLSSRITGQEFIERNLDQHKTSINLSSLIIGSKDNSFILYTNFIGQNGWLHSDSSTRTKYRSDIIDGDLLKMINEYIQMTKVMGVFSRKEKFNGITRRLLTANNGEREFTVGKDNDEILEYYRNLRNEIGTRQPSVHRQIWHGIKNVNRNSLEKPGSEMSL